MTLRPIYGHETLMDRLGGTLASSRFPQAVLLVGRPGVGKQRLALWVAQGLLCHEGPGVPCGECLACKQVNGLQYPDLHWFVPIERPKATQDPEKLLEDAKQQLADVMAQRRENPLWERPTGSRSHSIASARLFHRLAWVTPFAGSRKVFILGDAERLIVQESSHGAANALLKVLEEPPADTTILLTTADAHALLPTIRSRVVTVHVPPVPDEVVRRFLETEIDPPLGKAALDRRTLLAEGCVGRAQWAEEHGSEADRRAGQFLEAVRRGPDSWAPVPLTQLPWEARGEFTAVLDSLAVQLRAELERATQDGAPAGKLRKHIRALERVEDHRTAAQGNANPRLALAVLAKQLERLQ
jgi:DNA polymerase-3 subunit delta'